MILFEVYAEGIAFRPFKSNAPWAIDVQAIARRRPVQPMELHPGQVEVRQRGRLIQRIQASQNARLQVGPHLGAGTGEKKRPESGVPETSDHRSIVKQRLTAVKTRVIGPAAQ